MSDVAYDGIYGFPFSFTFTPTTGPSFGTAQAQVEEADTPEITIETAKYTPISGPNAGIEQFALGKYPVQTYKMKVTYAFSEHSAALTCQAAKVKGTLVCTYSDGHSDTYPGSALTTVMAGSVTSSNLRTAMLTFTVPVPGTAA